MKKIISIVVAASLGLFAMNASAVLTATVGSPDSYVASTTLADSSEAGEQAWIESEIGAVTSYTKLASSAGDEGGWVEVTDDGVASWAYDFGDLVADYFLVKTGSGGSTVETHTLFLNNGETDWGYILASDFVVGPLENLGRISHVAIVTTSDVPEPGTLALIGLGLLGLGLARKRQA